jgi:type VI secretion system protein ImpK
MATHSVVEMEAEGRIINQLAMSQRRAPVTPEEVEP